MLFHLYLVSLILSISLVSYIICISSSYFFWSILQQIPGINTTHPRIVQYAPVIDKNMFCKHDDALSYLIKMFKNSLTTSAAPSLDSNFPIASKMSLNGWYVLSRSQNSYLQNLNSLEELGYLSCSRTSHVLGSPGTSPCCHLTCSHVPRNLLETVRWRGLIRLRLSFHGRCLLLHDIISREYLLLALSAESVMITGFRHVCLISLLSSSLSTFYLIMLAALDNPLPNLILRLCLQNGEVLGRVLQRNRTNGR